MEPSSGPGAPGPKFLVVGRISRPHGVRGDLRVQVLTHFPERMARLTTVYLGRDPEATDHLIEYHVVQTRPDRDAWLIRLEGVRDRTAGELLRDLYVLVPLAEAVPLQPDEVYLFQVMGLEVRTVEGEVLGRVEDVIETGANDVYVVRGERYGEVLLPDIESVILSINPEKGHMIVRLLPGLL